LITPAICCNCFSKVDEDAMNFIRRNLSEAKLLKITLLATLFGPAEATLILVLLLYLPPVKLLNLLLNYVR
jgi:hypothetical protein